MCHVTILGLTTFALSRGVGTDALHATTAMLEPIAADPVRLVSGKLGSMILLSFEDVE